jgi:hypothetical protein
VVHYVAQLPNGRVFENSLERGAPFDVRSARLHFQFAAVPLGGCMPLMAQGPWH